MTACAAIGCNDMLGLKSPTLEETQPVEGTSSFGSTTSSPGGSTASVPTGSATLAGAWAAPESLPLLSVGRALHTATPLSEEHDTVVFWGGCSHPKDPPVDVFGQDKDGHWAAWSAKSKAPCPRGHTAIADDQGVVIAAGGFVGDADTLAFPGVTRFNFQAKTTEFTQSPQAAVYRTATAIDEGWVLLAGGSPSGLSTQGESTAFLWKSGDASGAYPPFPGEEVCQDAASECMRPRTLHTATLLPGGGVLVAGGWGTIPGGKQGPLDSADKLVALEGAFKPAGTMKTPRWLHAAVLLQDGRVLVTGGFNGGPLDSAEVFDPAEEPPFHLVQRMGSPRAGHTATLLPDGRVLVAGGSPDATAEIYDPIEGAWTPTPAMSVARYRHTATLVKGGNVLIAGGWDELLPEDATSVWKSVELYMP